MAEPRKIVFILGNGFDLDLGLKTSYKDFWESEYCPKDYPAPLIRHLNNRWPNSRDAVKWYDLENELLSYAIHGDKSDVVTVHERDYIQSNSNYTLHNRINYFGGDDMITSLVEKGYMKISKDVSYKVSIPYKDDYSQTEIWRDHRAFLLIKDGLCKYLNSIFGQSYESESVALNVLFAVEKARESGDLLNIYTFNFTQLPVDYGDGFCDIVHHVHGCYSDERIIVGTRDDVSIDESYDFLQKSFDSHFNPPALVADLLEADEVIIFGHSIGKNDRQYFKAFFKQQTDYSHPKCKEITIFTRDKESEIQIKRSLQQMTDGNLSTLFGLNHLQIIKTANLSEEKKRMFDFLVNHHIERHHAEMILGKLMTHS